MQLWFDYRTVWARHPWVLAYFVIVVAVLALAVVGTVLRVGTLAFLFVPSLAGAYVHHVMVIRRLDAS